MIKRTVNNSYKIVIILLCITIFCSLLYINNQNKYSRNIIISLRQEKLLLTNEKKVIINDLEKSKIDLDKALSNKSLLSKKLITERNKINLLLLQLKRLNNNNINNKQINIFRKEAFNSELKITALIKELNSYKKKVDSTNFILENERKTIDTLQVFNKKLAIKVSDAAKLYFYDLKAICFKQKKSGNLIETGKASKTDIVKISFMIAENDFAIKSTKEFYIQIIDSKNNIIGSKTIEKIGDKTLHYSALTSIQYEKKTIEVIQQIPTKNLKKDSLTVNIYDKSELILKTSLILY